MIYKHSKHMQFILMIVCGLIASLQTILVAYMVQTLTNIATNRSWNNLEKFLVIIIVGFIITLCASLTFNHLKTNVVKYVNTYLRTNIFSGMLNQTNDQNIDSLGFLTNDFKLLEENRFNAQINIIMHAFSLVLALTYALCVNWVITILFLIGSFMPIIVSGLFQKSIKYSSEKWTELNSRYVNQTKNFLAGAEILKLYQANKEATKRNNKVVKELESSLQKMNVLEMDAQSWIQTIANLITFLIPFLVGIYLVMQGKTTLGALFAIVQLANNFVNPILIILDERNKLSTTKKIAQKTKAYLKLKDSEEALKKDFRFKNLVLKDITLAMQDKVLVSGLDIGIKAGEKLAIIGPSGIGKSTLLQFLITGKNGHVDYAELNGKQNTNKNLESIFAYASQKPIIFADDLWFNLTLGKNISWEKVKEVCAKLDLIDIIDEKGWNYQLGENVDKLSGGQLARMALARAILAERPILLLDEINASLDKGTSDKIHNFLLKSNLTFLEVIHHYEKNDLSQYDQVFDLSAYLSN